MDQDTDARAGEAGALLRLLRLLAERDYRFVTPTPATHRHALTHAPRWARNLRDVFGWSLPFLRDSLDREILDALQAAGAVEPDGDGLRARVRVASLDDLLFLHSAFPPGDDGVFFGPDSYRFARLLQAEVRPGKVGALLDVGAGSGVGGIVAARTGGCASLVLSDSNPCAGRLARANAAFAGVAASFCLSDGLAGVDGRFDLVIANPPFMADEGNGAQYRDGGDLHGGRLSLDWARAAVSRLLPGGRLILYTGAAIVDGRDELGEALQALGGPGLATRYWEIDPDIHAEDLAAATYDGVERIAAVAFVAERKS